MKHLTEREIVDLIDHALAPERMEHAAACTKCSARAEMARDMLTRLDDAEVPEPSPLFWEHFSARVREGIHDAVPSSSWWALTQSSTLKWALAGVLIAVVLAGGTWLRSGPVTQDRPAGTIAVASPGSTATIDDGLESEPIEADVAWGLVRTVADDVSWDDTVDAGLGASPGSVERAVRSLTVAERAELIALLQAETKRPGA